MSVVVQTDPLEPDMHCSRSGDAIAANRSNPNDRLNLLLIGMRDTLPSQVKGPHGHRAGLMTISSIMTTALSGMQTEQNRMVSAASNIASSGPGAAAQTDAEIDLASEMLDVMSAETNYKANALVLEAGADLWDVLMTIKRD